MRKSESWLRLVIDMVPEMLPREKCSKIYCHLAWSKPATVCFVEISYFLNIKGLLKGI